MHLEIHLKNGQCSRCSFSCIMRGNGRHIRYNHSESMWFLLNRKKDHKIVYDFWSRGIDTIGMLTTCPECLYSDYIQVNCKKHNKDFDRNCDAYIKEHHTTDLLLSITGLYTVKGSFSSTNWLGLNASYLKDGAAEEALFISGNCRSSEISRCLKFKKSQAFTPLRRQYLQSRRFMRPVVGETLWTANSVWVPFNWPGETSSTLCFVP